MAFADLKADVLQEVQLGCFLIPSIDAVDCNAIFFQLCRILAQCVYEGFVLPLTKRPCPDVGLRLA